MIKYVKKFAALPSIRKKMVVQVLFLSIYTFFLFRFFKKFARFGQTITVDNNLQTIDNRAIDIAYAIQVVNNHVPWKTMCRHHAYQAKFLCSWNELACLIYIGFKKNKDNNEIEAHAWTIAGGKIITGFCNPNEYTVQNIYINR